MPLEVTGTARVGCCAPGCQAQVILGTCNFEGVGVRPVLPRRKRDPGGRWDSSGIGEHFFCLDHVALREAYIQANYDWQRRKDRARTALIEAFEEAYAQEVPLPTAPWLTLM